MAGYIKTKIPVKAYTKRDLRVILMNPDIDLKNEKAVSEAVAMDPVKFRKLMREKLEGVVPESEWKETNSLSADVVRVLVC